MLEFTTSDAEREYHFTIDGEDHVVPSFDFAPIDKFIAMFSDSERRDVRKVLSAADAYLAGCDKAVRTLSNTQRMMLVKDWVQSGHATPGESGTSSE